MTTVRRRLDQIGGPSALTLPAWLLSLPLTVLISNVYATTPTLKDVVVWTTALVFIHCALGLIMWAGRNTVLQDRPRNPRPAAAIGIFALMGLARALLLTWTSDLLGFGAFDLSERLAFNVVATVVLFSALAIVIDDYRAHKRAMGRLLSAQENLERLRTSDLASAEQLDRQILADVEQRLNAELAAEGVDASRVRALSEDVVRKMSHELVAPVGTAALVPAPLREPSPWMATSAVIQRMRVPNPFLVMGTFAVLVFGTEAARWGLPFALLDTTIGNLPTVAVLWVLRRFLRLPEQPLLRLVTLTLPLGLLVAGVAAAKDWAINAWTGSLLDPPYSVGLAATSAGVVGLMLLMSTWTSVSEGRAARQEELTQAVLEETRAAGELQSLIEERRLAASRFLHGSIQSELISAALRGDDATSVSDSLAQVFLSYGSDIEASSAESRFNEIIRAWGSILEIELRIDPGSWEQLNKTSERRSLFIDVISEGFTNASRHSSAREVTLTVEPAAQGTLVAITTLGVMAPGESAGLGVRDIAGRATHTTLECTGGRTTLSVLIS